ncbi:ATP-dependent RNA helicase HrpA [Galbitalea sp. SE-J8]|uniref:ATP-dependent RNA helicase HrpA n=1 Tax=Galbitalea sp. SE-J8 TaxID=3054952 RepID=UPI00259D01EF|nr:ATP-dependent RNA helicase HrpA [Galbitalea sp. SE-J8]MDM4762103.1 ATP-dependent RNA helicase HrpA [Galbitalea sp. SE-J8]
MSETLPTPTIVYPPELPVSGRRDDIMAAIRDHQVVVVAGATGSGKTTQLPKMLLELGYERIAHTQPRRIAARTIAERIADELGSDLGGLVGYQVRFTDQVSKSTRVTLMTDGILLNRIHRDRDLTGYDAIIIDEAHERSLTVDFLLGYLTRILPRRPELKVIVTSATIDPESFARHFSAATGAEVPIIEVSGRTFPVDIRYRPLVRTDAATDDPDDSPVESVDLMTGVADAVAELMREPDGDILVFLSGEAEIRDAEDVLRGRRFPGTEILPLYGRLSAADQHRVFERSTTPGTRRRVVLATNVAETSLTVPGIRYVVDAGTARISRYSARAKIQRLPIEAISQASANQRSGRSGRTSPGIAIRLYSEEDFAKRPEFTEPEILRTNLAAVILQMISLGLGDIGAFPFLQPPDARGVKDGMDLLRELGAVDSGSRDADPRITRIGRQLAQLPVDPRLGRMIVESKKHGVSREVIAIVAGLSIQDPRERPLDKRAHADQLHARFTDPTSDFMTLLALWDYLKTKEKELSGSAFRRLTRAEYINFLRFREWEDVSRQLTRLAKQIGLTIDEATETPDAAGIHRSLLAGLLSQLGIRTVTSDKTGAKREYAGSRNTRFAIFPGSALAKKQPEAVMSAELVETSRLFARMNAAIDPAWAEPIAGDLVKRSVAEPHWSQKSGAAMAYERVTLYGVPIVPRRRIQFARVDAAEARELLIREGLVAGLIPREWKKGRAWEFERRNHALRAELAEIEERTRRRDILLDDENVVRFFDERIPADVTDVRGFERWWRQQLQSTPDLLTMTPEALVDDATDTDVDERMFPREWHQGDQTLALSYRFEPGADDDGVTVSIPLPLLPSIRPAGFDWLVPGLREELVAAMIKTLPKAIRRSVVPANDWARRFVDELNRTLVEERASAASPRRPPLVEERASAATPHHTPLVEERASAATPHRPPVEERASAASPRLETTALDETPIAEWLAEQVRRHTYTPMDADDVDGSRIPAHLRMRFTVVDDRGRTIAASRDLTALRTKLASRTRQSVANVIAAAPVRVANAIERAGLTTFAIDELPRAVDTPHGTGTVRGYPAFVDDGATVSIRVLPTAGEQLRAMRGGIRRMLLLAIPSPVSYVQEHLTTAEKLALAASPYRSTAALFEDCLVACIDAVVPEPVWTRAEFDAARDRVSAGILDQMFAVVAQVATILGAQRDADKAISSASSLALMAPLADAREQLANLVYPGFVSAAGVAQLPRIAVYLRGIQHRVSKLAENVGRDRTWMAELAEATQRYVSAGGDLPLAPGAPAHLRHARWMLEELRLSLFAQHLGTAEPVSLQRITRVLSSPAG